MNICDLALAILSILALLVAAYCYISVYVLTLKTLSGDPRRTGTTLLERTKIHLSHGFRFSLVAERTEKYNQKSNARSKDFELRAVQSLLTFILLVIVNTTIEMATYAFTQTYPSEVECEPDPYGLPPGFEPMYIPQTLPGGGGANTLNLSAAVQMPGQPSGARPPSTWFGAQSRAPLVQPSADYDYDLARPAGQRELSRPPPPSGGDVCPSAGL